VFLSALRKGESCEEEKVSPIENLAVLHLSFPVLL